MALSAQTSSWRPFGRFDFLLCAFATQVALQSHTSSITSVDSMVFYMMHIKEWKLDTKKASSKIQSQHSPNLRTCVQHSPINNRLCFLISHSSQNVQRATYWNWALFTLKYSFQIFVFNIASREIKKIEEIISKQYNFTKELFIVNNSAKLIFSRSAGFWSFIDLDKMLRFTLQNQSAKANCGFEFNFRFVRKVHLYHGVVVPYMPRWR